MWLQAAVAQQEARAKAFRAVAWWQKTCAARAFAAWCDVVGARRAERAALLRAVARWRAGTLARCMQEWKGSASQATTQRTLAVLAMHHWMRRYGAHGICGQYWCVCCESLHPTDVAQPHAAPTQVDIMLDRLLTPVMGYTCSLGIT